MEGWHEQDAFWVKWAPFLFGEQRCEEGPEQAPASDAMLTGGGRQAVFYSVVVAPRGESRT